MCLYLNLDHSVLVLYPLFLITNHLVTLHSFQVIGYSSNLTIFISPSTVGKYTCHVSVRGYRDVSASSHVYARGPPVIVKSPETRVHYGALGDNVQVKFRPLITLIQSSVVTNSKIPPNTEHIRVLKMC